MWWPWGLGLGILDLWEIQIGTAILGTKALLAYLASAVSEAGGLGLPRIALGLMNSDAEMQRCSRSCPGCIFSARMVQFLVRVALVDASMDL